MRDYTETGAAPFSVQLYNTSNFLRFYEHNFNFFEEYVLKYMFILLRNY